MNKTWKSGRKVTVLISRIEVDCRLNIERLIEDGRAVAQSWGVRWEAPCWDTRHVFSHTKRSHRSERKAMNMWFTERSTKPKTLGAPFLNPFGDVVRSLVVLRHQVGNQCFVDQQQVIIASQFIYERLREREHDLVRLTPGDLDAACMSISATQAPATAYKLHRFVEEIAATIDRNHLCITRLNFRYAKKNRPIEVGGLNYARLDNPDLAKGVSAKLIPENLLRALGYLYQTIPVENLADRLLINIIVIAFCTGRRIGEILTLPNQQVQYDRNDHAYLLYYAEKRSQGSQIIVLDKLFLIPQTVPLVSVAIEETIKITAEARSVAKRIRLSGEPETSMLPGSGYLCHREIDAAFGLSRGKANAWCNSRNIEVAHTVGRKSFYARADIVDAMRRELWQGPAVHATPPAKDLELEDLLFIAFKHSFHGNKATLKYAVMPVNVRNIGDFLGARGAGAFQRYFEGQEQDSFRITSHQFRHTLNTLLQRGGMSDALQTEWFRRKNPDDTKAYQHMTPAEQAFAAYQATSRRFEEDPMPLRPGTRSEAIEVSLRSPVLDVGPGWCQHDWRSRPCPRHLEVSLHTDALFWVGTDPDAHRAELIRLQEISELVLAKAQHVSASGVEEAGRWVEHLRIRLDAIRSAIDDHDNDTRKQ